jgi:hypothetical protein
MNIYISSSWKNRERVREIADALTEKGHSVYDFTNPACRKTPVIPPEKYPEEFDPETHIYRDYIQKAEWRTAVLENKAAIENAGMIILLLPCGNDSHADWAYGLGLGKKSVVAGSPRKGERSPVHMWADAIVDNEQQLYEFIAAAGGETGNAFTPCPSRGGSCAGGIAHSCRNPPSGTERRGHKPHKACYRCGTSRRRRMRITPQGLLRRT